MMTAKPVNRALLRFQEAIVFQDHLIVPIGRHYRVFDPDGLILSGEPNTMADAQELVVSAVIRDQFLSQIDYWRESGLLSGVQAEVMRQDVHQLV